MMKQYFSIQSSKRLFMTDQDGILESDQLLGRECISHNGLTPLLVMAVADARLKLRRCRYFLPDQPLSAATLLSEFWSVNVPNNLLIGVPDELVIDKRLQGVLSEAFFEWLTPLCAWSWSDTKDRAFAAKMRLLQERQYPSATFLGNSDEHPRLTLADVNKGNFAHEHLWAGSDYLPVKDRDYVQALVGRTQTVLPEPVSAPPLDFDPRSPQLELYKRSDYNLPGLWINSEPGDYPWLTTVGNQEDERRYFLDKGEFRHLKTVLQASPVPLKTWARMYECDLAELQQFLLGHCPPPAVFKTAMREKETEVPLGFWVLHAKKVNHGPFADLLDAIFWECEPYCSLELICETQPVQPQRLITLMSDQFSALFVIERDSEHDRTMANYRESLEQSFHMVRVDSEVQLSETNFTYVLDMLTQARMRQHEHTFAKDLVDTARQCSGWTTM